MGLMSTVAYVGTTWQGGIIAVPVAGDSRTAEHVGKLFLPNASFWSRTWIFVIATTWP